MNPVVILTHNNLELTKHCVESVRKQDIPVHIYVFDNYSTDGTQEWTRHEWEKPDFTAGWALENKGVSYGWNVSLERAFVSGAEHVLVANNDTILPPWFYSELLMYKQPFVTGVSVNQMEQIATPLWPMPLQPHPDFSAFLITRECWKKVGPFDERMKHYASDLDYHVRAHRAGVNLWQANLPFYHERSSTLKNASPEERAQIERQADADRAVFQAKWNVACWSTDYAKMFTDETFGIDAQVDPERSR